MQVLVEMARHVGNKYKFRVRIHPDRPVEEQQVEQFTYGDDVPLATIRNEFLALLANKYEDPLESILPFEGQTFEL